MSDILLAPRYRAVSSSQALVSDENSWILRRRVEWALHGRKPKPQTPIVPIPELERNRLACRARYDRLRAAGLCPHCGRRQPQAGKRWCDVCREQSMGLSKWQRAKWRAAGLCIQCGAERQPDRACCPRCAERNRRSATASNRRRQLSHRIHQDFR